MRLHTAMAVTGFLLIAATATAQQSSVTADVHNGASPASPNVDVTTGNSTTSAFRVFNSASTELFSVVASGHVDVTGNLRLLGTPALIRSSSNADTYGLKFIGTRFAIGQINSRAYNYAGSALAFIGGVNDGWELLNVQSYSGKGRLVLTQASVDTLSLALLANDVPAFTVTPAGRVGIGTSAPDSVLHVKGTANQWAVFERLAKQLFINANFGAANQYSQIANRATDLMGLSLSSRDTNPEFLYIAPDGKIGAGTTIPRSPLHIVKNAAGTLGPELILENNANSVGDAEAVTFAANGQSRAQIRSTVEPNPWYGSIEFRTGFNSLTERMRITGAGTVAIGTATPAAGVKLHVVGNSTFTGNMTVSGSITGATVLGAAYQDLAEWVPSKTPMEPGTVVVVSPDANNQVMSSFAPYDTSVAGVVSAQPGVLLGVAGDDKEMIATTGRVRVKVDATTHPIRVGDLLVSSDKPGMAMKSIPLDLGGTAIHRPGTLIGKALEPLASGEGEILVLLSLQ